MPAHYLQILQSPKMSLFSNGAKEQPNTFAHQSLAQNKRDNFRMEIRHRQIQKMKQEIRMKFYQLKDPNDYQLLRNIDLTKLISQCKKHNYNYNHSHDNMPIRRLNLSPENIHKMFLYASSQNSDHLFTLLDDDFIDGLISQLIIDYGNGNENGQGQGQGDEEGKEEVKWDRKILWILTNYTSYSQILHQAYLKKLEIIGKFVYGEREKLCPFVQETQQNILLSLSNLISDSKTCRKVLQNNPQLLLLHFTRFLNRKPSLSQVPLLSSSSLPKILQFYSQFFHNLYTNITYFQIEQQLQYHTIKAFIPILDNVMSERVMSEDGKKVCGIFLQGLIRLFGNSLDANPELILAHRKEIARLAEWFEKFMKTQKESPKSDQIIVSYLTFLQIVYGPNIPQQYERKIMKLYTKLFQNHVGRVCQAIFLNKKGLYHTYALKLLQPILLQQVLAQLILNSYLPIISHIFWHIKNSTFGLKKQALICLVNLLKSTLYDGSTSSGDIFLELLLANKVADVLAYNLWAFVDAQLNYELVEAIGVLLETQKNQYGAKLGFWLAFNEAGGVLKMERILQESKDQLIKSQIIKILDSVKRQENIEQ